MKGIVEFEGCNAIFKAPEGRDDISDLHLFRGPVANVFAVELTNEEHAEYMRTGLIYVSILSGSTFFPVYVGSESSVRAIAADYGPVWKRGQVPDAVAQDNKSTIDWLGGIEACMDEGQWQRNDKNFNTLCDAFQKAMAIIGKTLPHPMPTAPHDGTKILGLTPNGWDIVWYTPASSGAPDEYPHEAGWWGTNETMPAFHDQPAQCQPYVWMPLPPYRAKKDAA